MGLSGRMKRMNNCVALSVEEGDGFRGKLYHSFAEEPVDFSDITGCLYVLEALLDKYAESPPFNRFMV